MAKENACVSIMEQSLLVTAYYQARHPEVSRKNLGVCVCVSKNIDEGLLNFDVVTTHQPGAEHAPYYFVSRFLFSNDILNIYKSISTPVWMIHGVRGTS